MSLKQNLIDHSWFSWEKKVKTRPCKEIYMTAVYDY